jgi:hypothetical protein
MPLVIAGRRPMAVIEPGYLLLVDSTQWRGLPTWGDACELGCRRVSLVREYIGRKVINLSIEDGCAWSVHTPLGWRKSGELMRVERRRTALSGGERNRFVLGCLGSRW